MITHLSNSHPLSKTTPPPFRSIMTTFQTHQDLVRELDTAVANGKIRVGDVILWGFDKTMLHSVLLNNAFPPHNQLPALIAYTTVDLCATWSETITHVSMVVRLDPTKTGAESIITIESATDRHSGYSGLMEHPLLYYCDPNAPRSMKIVRFNSTAGAEGPLLKTYCDLLDKVIHKAPFLTSQQSYTSVWSRMKSAVTRGIPFLGDPNPQVAPTEPHLPKKDEKLSIGLGYNQYQLLQYAVAVANANDGDDVFDELRWALKLANSKMVTSCLTGHDRGSFFCSQAIAEIAFAVQQSIEQDPTTSADANNSPFKIVFPSTLFEKINDCVKDPSYTPTVDKTEVVIDPLDAKYFQAVAMTGFPVEDPTKEHRGEAIAFVVDPVEEIKNKVTECVLKRFRSDIALSIANETQLDQSTINDVLSEMERGGYQTMSQKMNFLAAKFGATTTVLDQMILGAVRTTPLAHPSLPNADTMKGINTNVFGYVSPSDFTIKPSNGKNPVCVFQF